MQCGKLMQGGKLMQYGKLMYEDGIESYADG
jgi:hypothetical protein